MSDSNRRRGSAFQARDQACADLESVFGSCTPVGLIPHPCRRSWFRWGDAALVASGGWSAAMALGILGIVVKGLFYLLFTGIGVLLVAFLLGAFWMRRRTARRRPAR